MTCKHPFDVPEPAVSMELGTGKYAWGLVCLVGFRSWASVQSWGLACVESV